MVDAKNITLALGGKWNGRNGLACCPAHDDTKPSLSIRDGNNGRVLLYCFAGCRYYSIVDALPDLELSLNQPVTFSEDKETERRMKLHEEKRRKSRQAWNVWKETLSLHRTPGEKYLKSRGIDVIAPASLRYHPNCWHGPSAKRLPALVAKIDLHRYFGIHRTYLKPDGSGKADVESAKMMLGPAHGGAVRLSAAPGPLIVAEGIETALSAGMLFEGKASVWATLSTSGMSGLNLPEKPGEIIVAIDGDRPGRDAGSVLARRARREGWKVRTWQAWDDTDFNDILVAQQGSAA